MVSNPLKNTSQLGCLCPTYYGKNKHVPNHQPAVWFISAVCLTEHPCFIAGSLLWLLQQTFYCVCVCFPSTCVLARHIYSSPRFTLRQTNVDVHHLQCFPKKLSRNATGGYISDSGTAVQAARYGQAPWLSVDFDPVSFL